MSDHIAPDWQGTSVSPVADHALFTDREAVRARVAAALLEIGAVTRRPNDPYLWTSGLRSPVYTDNRVTRSHPAVRTLIADSSGRDIIATRMLRGTRPHHVKTNQGARLYALVHG